MNLAVAVPGNDSHARVRSDVRGEKLIRHEDDLIRAESFDDVDGVCRRAARIAFRLDRRIGVHVAHDGRAWILGAQRTHVGGRDGIGERAAGLERRQQHGLLR